MFEVQCPNCHASYKVDERRIPATGLDMRCPKCGTSFQVAAPGLSEPPVLGGALGLGGPPRGAHKATMLGVAGQGADTAPPTAPQPLGRSGAPGAARRTMLGVAPAAPAASPPPARQRDDQLELASLDEAELEKDELEAELGGDAGAEELDLPTPSPRGVGAEIDLPVPASSRRSSEVDLPGLHEDAAELDLPAIAGGGVDLPSPLGDLPSPADAVDLPDLLEAELPTLGAALPVPSAAGLPAVGGAGLPTVSGGLPALSGAGLPSVGGAALPDLTEYELPVVGGSIPSPGGSPRNPTGLPSMAAEVPDFDMAPPRRGRAPAVDDGGFALSHAPQPPSISFDVPASDQAAGDDLFGDGPAPAPASAPPRRSSDPGAFGEVDLDSAPASAGDDVEEFDAFPTEAARPAAGTSANYGDVSLDGGGGELGLGADLERAPAPQGPAPAASAQVELPGRETAEAPAVKAPRSGLSKGARVAIVGSVVLAVAGGALGALSPRIGPYGAYAVMDFVQADSHAAALAADVKSARALLDADSVTALEEAFARVDAGRSSAPRHEARAAYAAYLGLLRQLRFGRDASIGPAAQVLLDGLAEASPAEVEHLALARVAGLAAAANPLEAVAQAKGHEAENIDYAALLGEVALLARDLPTAELAWKAALGHSRSARSHFGMARTQLHKGDRAGARTSADAALALSSGHVGALLLVTEIEVSERKLDEELVLRLTPIVEGQAKASDGERVLAMILLGDLHMARSRVKKAEESFTRALAIEAGSAAAQRGLADAIFASGRYGEAQTRYEAALKADPGSLPAGVGLVRCKLRLEQLEEAGKLLAALQTQHPESTIVQYWMGRAKELVGDRAAAQAAYEKAIALAQNSEELVQSYVSLTRLLGQAGRAEEAAVVIAQAEQKFPSDPLVYEALAELSLGRGSFEDAVRDYDRALALDPKNVGLHFARGVALRQARRFDEAFKEFELVEKESKDYPGLALERGNLYEASGRSEEALRAYEAALAVAPEDPDLMLRVGCGRAQAGASEDGLKLLEQVQKSRPNSAEVNFCLGLAYLHMDGRLPDARRHLNRAVGFDGSRATYHLYVGWVALELADYPTAARSLDKALELDRTLADAYWKRGEMLVRQGAVADAELDLRRALELSPTRTEAHAELAKAYAQLGEEPKALVEWALACVGAGAKAYDHYQYGRLLLDNRRTAEAEVELRKAIEKVSPVEPAPMWRWEAHRLYASALGRRREALEHWQAFVDHGPRNSPYLKEAQREMAAILDMLGH